MIYPSINLLKKTERRYQGAVSRRFIFVIAVVAPILLIALLSGIKLIQYSSVQSSLSLSREVWKEIEPRLVLFEAEKKGLLTNRDVLKLFDGWQHTQTSFVSILDEIQDKVPEQIQFRRLSLRSNPSASSYTSAEEMKLIFNLTVDGSSSGEHAENNVISFRRDLLNSERTGSVFDSIKLASMRKRQSVTGVNVREFKLEGITAKGGDL